MSTVRNMIEAATSNNPAEFEKHFVAVTTERLGTALAEMRADVYKKVLGLAEEDDCDDEDKDKMKDDEDEDGDEDDSKDSED